MDLFGIGFFILLIASSNLWVAKSITFNVLQYGAKGDAQTNDSPAFLEAWKATCGSTDGAPTLLVPAGRTFLLQQQRFAGPCKSESIHIHIMGTLLAPKKDESGACSKRWLSFYDINGLILDGSGVIDGRGQDWWKNDGKCRASPTALVFDRCNGLQVKGLTHRDGPASHLTIFHSNDVTVSNVNITAPLGSHNTDGIDISHSDGVNIFNSYISTGDDNIAIKGGSSNINISGITCGIGHGISVGSLGSQSGEEDIVKGVHVFNCSFDRADSAAKIKTWAGGKGMAKGITFDHITVTDTNFPIYIDQHYFNSGNSTQAVKVSDVTFSKIQGTSLNENAIVLDCAEIGCDNIVLRDINITSSDPKKPASATCQNVKGSATNTYPRPPCLSSQLDNDRN